MGSPVIFSGNTAKLLKSTLDFFGQSQILSGTADPTSVATSAPIGSLYMNSSSGTVYKKNDAGSTTNWTALSTGGGSSTLKVATIQDQKTSGSNGGTFTSGSYQQRTLNTLNDPSSIVSSLTANQFTLAAGTYLIHASCPCRDVGTNKAKLRNVTDSTDTIIGQSSESGTTGGVFCAANVDGVFTIAGAKTFEIDHRCSTSQTTDGFGAASTFGDVEVYTSVVISKIA